MTTTLITGGAGFIGRHVVAAFAGDGDDVVSYDRDPVVARAGVRSEQGELYDIPRLCAVLRDHGVDRIVHTAAMSHPEVSIAMPVATFSANVDGTVAVLEAVRLAGVQDVVYFSSESVFGDHPGEVREDTPYAPTTPYAVTKVATEYLADVYRRLYGLRIVSLRPTEVYGPGNRMPSVVHDCLAAGIAGRPLRFPAGGDHAFNLVHVADVAAATLLAAQRLAGLGPAYNVAGGPPTTLRELIAYVIELFPGADLSAGPGILADRYAQGAYDPALSRDELGHVPAWDIRRGLATYAEVLRQTVDS